MFQRVSWPYLINESERRELGSPLTNPTLITTRPALMIRPSMTSITLCLVVPALGLQSLVVTRSALLTPCITNRCALPRAAAQGGEGWVDVDDSGDECVVSGEGWSCISDVAGPIGVDGTRAGLDAGRRNRSPVIGSPDTDEGRHRRSPGMMGNFNDLSIEDFKKPYGAKDGTESEVPDFAPVASTSDFKMPYVAKDASVPKAPATPSVIAGRNDITPFASVSRAKVTARTAAPVRKPTRELAGFPQFSSGLLR